MSRYAGLVQRKAPQRLPENTPSADKAFYNRAIRAQQKQRGQTAETVIKNILSEDQREEQAEQQWKIKFEAWWERKMESANRGGHARRLAKQGTLDRHGQAVNSLTLEEWKEIQARYHFKCAYCQQRRPLTKDHIVPISKGGFHTRINVIPACHSCNSKKGNRPAFLYRPTLIPFE